MQFQLSLSLSTLRSCQCAIWVRRAHPVGVTHTNLASPSLPSKATRGMEELDKLGGAAKGELKSLKSLFEQSPAEVRISVQNHLPALDRK